MRDQWRARFGARPARAATPISMAFRLAFLLTAVVVAIPAIVIFVAVLGLLIAAVVVFLVLLVISFLITPFVFLIKRAVGGAPPAEDAGPVNATVHDAQPGEPDADGRRNVRVLTSDNAADET